ncbi:hypothetical protein LUZ61_001030 [Rhynchospora tenuis]|uniref:Dirigent protein n=1 Tax=Rhynchospora tenuis TaxID=198213 RepID=A0AAD5ZG89_9POAL|nr:hypothetical protein LUZ61_001030 [Rhynchospora tenuis]
MAGIFQITPIKKELKIRLYLQRKFSGSNRNQMTVYTPSGTSFGIYAINDWTFWDSIAPTAKVIARGRGPQFQAGVAGMEESRWFNIFNLVFEDPSFKGSTLKVMGATVTEDNSEWTIVGGSGEFTRAQGIIDKKTVQKTNDGDVLEINIHAFYAPLV